MQTAATFPYPPDDPERVRDLSARFSRVAARCDAASDALHQDAGLLAPTWQGSAATVCRDELRHTARLTRRVAGPLRRASLVLDRFADEVARARAAIDRLRADYDDEVARQRHELSVRRSAVPARRPQLERLRAVELQWAHQHELAAHHRRYTGILDELLMAARALRRELAALAWEVHPAASGRSGAAADAEALLVRSLPLLAAQRRLVAGSGGQAPGAGTPAGQVRLWWALLCVDEQQRLVESAPGSIGNLDGLPAHVRSSANERALDRLLAVLRDRDDLDDAEQRTLDNCHAVRDAIAVARRHRAPRSWDGSVVQLLAFDPRAFGGEGRAAVAMGDVDTADHVAFLVPGLNSNLRKSLPGLLGNAALLGREAERAGAGSATATVAWMGYDAPGLTNVAGDGAAESGADLLAADVLAVQAARDVAPHLTVVGHSYGSTTTGTALRDHVTGVDDAVLVGSPGPNVEHVGELRVPAGHVFVGANSRDPVSYLDRFGLDPTHASFGALRFQAEDVTRNSWRVDLSDHSKYFEPKTESLANIADIVVGNYTEVEVAAYREETPFLPDGINADPEADREPTVPEG